MGARIRQRPLLLLILAAVLAVSVACQPAATPVPAAPAAPGDSSLQPAGLKVIAAESFLADMAQNVAGDRLQVETLMPLGLDPHAFEPTPQDVARIADSDVLIVNGAGLEEWLDEVLQNAGGERLVVEASAGLASREVHGDEEAAAAEEAHAHEEGDPHFWLNPTNAIKYVENIRGGLSQADPAGKDVYAANAAAYIDQLKKLDASIAQQVEQIPPERRLIVTNHESFGYFADRYGFEVIGTVLPGASTGASPSAQQLAALIDQVRATGATAIFLETGANPQLADQVAEETGVAVVTDLYSHSVTPADGPAPSYIGMMRHNVQAILEALQP